MVRDSVQSVQGGMRAYRDTRGRRPHIALPLFDQCLLPVYILDFRTIILQYCHQVGLVWQFLHYLCEWRTGNNYMSFEPDSRRKGLTYVLIMRILACGMSQTIIRRSIMHV